MDKEELKKKFEENVLFLESNVPPDDIYCFAEQTFMACLYFLKKWSDLVDMNEELENDPIAKKWAVNILSLLHLRDLGEKVNIDLNLESLD